MMSDTERNTYSIRTITIISFDHEKLYLFRFDIRSASPLIIDIVPIISYTGSIRSIHNNITAFAVLL